MKAQFQKILTDQQSSFVAKQLDLQYFDCLFHFHPEYELKYVIQSRGKRFVGESIENFTEGDLVLVGPNIMHYWKNDSEYYITNKHQASAYLVMFSEDCFGEDFFSVPEMAPVKDLFSRAKRGLSFNLEHKSTIPQKMKRLVNAEGPAKIMSLIEVLYDLSQTKSRPILSENSVKAKPIIKDLSMDRLRKVHDFIINNFQNRITLQDVAEKANMTPHAFCKYFKKSTQKTFITFLIELRICHAKKLLIENSQTITEICYSSGFDNLSYFNRAFKSLTKMTPKEYRSQYNDNNIRL